MYTSLTQSQLDELLAASSKAGSSVRVSVDSRHLTIKLAAVVAISNYKALASLDRCGGARFDARSKSTYIPLLDPTLYKDRSDCPDDAVLVLNIGIGYKSEIFKLVRRLAGGKAKTYSSVGAAKAARKPRAPKPSAPSNARGQHREVWSDDEGDFVQAGEGWRR
jgi:hypothetical protein